MEQLFFRSFFSDNKKEPILFKLKKIDPRIRGSEGRSLFKNLPFLNPYPITRTIDLISFNRNIVAVGINLFLTPISYMTPSVVSRLLGLLVGCRLAGWLVGHS